MTEAPRLSSTRSPWSLAIFASVAIHIGVGTSVVMLAPIPNAYSTPPLDYQPIYLLPPDEHSPQPVADKPLQSAQQKPALATIENPMPIEVKPDASPVEVLVITPAPKPDILTAILGAENGPAVSTPSWMTSLAEGEHVSSPFEHDQPELDRVKETQTAVVAGGAKAQPNVQSPKQAQARTEVVEAKPERLKQDNVEPSPLPEGPKNLATAPGTSGGEQPSAAQSASAPIAAERIEAQPKVEATPAHAEQPDQQPSTQILGNDATLAPNATLGTGATDIKRKIASDRDSDATSIKREGLYKQGRVIAGEGLEIRTVRPDLSMTTRVLRSPVSPVLDIRFGRDGRVKSVRVVRSSGYPESVDAPVVSAAYNWRASGKLLNTLSEAPDSAVSLEITIVLQ